MGKENISTQFLSNTISQTINNELIDVNEKLEYTWTFFNRDINKENTHNRKYIEFNINIEKLENEKEYYKYNIKHTNEDNIEDDK